MMTLIIESRKRKQDAGRTEEDETENEEGPADGSSDGPSTQDSQEATSKPSKRARIAEVEEEGLIAAFIYVGDKLVKAIEKVSSRYNGVPGSRHNDAPEDLFDNLSSLPGFNMTHKYSFFVYLVANPRMGRAFNKLPLEH